MKYSFSGHAVLVMGAASGMGIARAAPVARQPIGCLAYTDGIAHAIAFLLSDCDSVITGAIPPSKR